MKSIKNLILACAGAAAMIGCGYSQSYVKSNEQLVKHARYGDFNVTGYDRNRDGKWDKLVIKSGQWIKQTITAQDNDYDGNWESIDSEVTNGYVISDNKIKGPFNVLTTIVDKNNNRIYEQFTHTFQYNGRTFVQRAWDLDDNGTYDSVSPETSDLLDQAENTVASLVTFVNKSLKELGNPKE